MIFPKIQRDVVNNKKPSWLNTALLPRIEKPKLEKVAKVAYATIQWYCPSCKKLYNRNNLELSEKIDSNPKCPDCGYELSSYKSVSYLNEDKKASYKMFLKEADLKKDSSGTYNTFVDRHLYWKTLNDLQKYARKMGMFGAVVRYLNSEHIQKEGQQYPMSNNFNYLIEWQYGYRQGNVLEQKKRVTATITIDAAGNVNMPKVFATLDGKEYPFDKAAIKSLEVIPAPPSAVKTPKMTDTLTFRQQEVSRIYHGFNFATASLNSEIVTKREINGKLHNENGPAVIHKDGSEEYWVNGELHRLDGPAIVGKDGFKAFFVHGQLHNSNGPAIIYPNGKVEIWFRGNCIKSFPLKRDMPKMISSDQRNLGKVGFDFYKQTVPGFHHKETDQNGTNYYFDSQNRLHRIDGFAVEYANGQGEYYINGQKISPEQHQQYVQRMELVARMTDSDHIVRELVKKSEKKILRKSGNFK